MDKEKGLNGGQIALGACGACLTVVVIGLALLFFSLSKTGLIGNKAPDAEPTRIVDASDVDLNAVEASIATAVLKSVGSGSTEIRLTEEMLTALIRRDIIQEVQGIDVENTQVAILEEGALEIYMPIEINGKSTVITMTILPTIEDGVLKMDVSQVLLGTLKAPSFIAGIPEQIINDEINSQITALGDKIDLKSIEFEKGALTISGKVNLDQFLGQ